CRAPLLLTRRRARGGAGRLLVAVQPAMIERDPDGSLAAWRFDKLQRFFAVDLFELGEEVSAVEDVAGSEKVLKSVCPSCHGGCSKPMHVKDGKLTKVEGDPEGPLNHGYLCPIGAATTQLVYHPDRLKYPQRRIGPRGSGKWERISWDEALDEITEKVLKIRAESGPDSIAMG